MCYRELTEALSRFRHKLPTQARLYVAGCSGEPVAIAEVFRQAPDLAANITFLGIWIPGVNQTDWASLHPTAKVESIFISSALRSAFEEQKAEFLPLSYVQSTEWLATTPLDGGVVMVTPPDANGDVSLGVSSDFSNIILARPDVRVFALINPAMPRPASAPTVSLSRFTESCTLETPLIEVPPVDLASSFTRIGAHIAAKVMDGDTLQFGVGNVQQAALEALTHHRDLRLHAGMISDPLLGLIEAEALASRRGTVTTGVAIGTRDLYDWAGQDPRIDFRPVSYTHAISTLAAIPRLKAINSAIEVDLFGQANAEFINGKQVSGAGGLVDFLRGAALSPGGEAIVALSSTTRRGTISRIVPRLQPDATSISRADVQTVITEHGAAELKGLSLDRRAEALIAIADPAFRNDLANTWATMRRAM